MDIEENTMRIVGMIVVASLALAGTQAGFAQSAAKPKSPGEIAAASEEKAEKNEACREKAKEQKLHGTKRFKFMKDCKKQP